MQTLQIDELVLERLGVQLAGDAVEDVHAEEVAGEVVQDVVLAVVEAALNGVIAQDERGGVGDLAALDGGLARREGVAAEVEWLRRELPYRDSSSA